MKVYLILNFRHMAFICATCRSLYLSCSHKPSLVQQNCASAFDNLERKNKQKRVKKVERL